MHTMEELHKAILQQPKQAPGSHGKETLSFAQDQGCRRFWGRKSFSVLESSTKNKTSCHDQDMSVHLVAVLSKVNESDIPRFDFGK